MAEKGFEEAYRNLPEVIRYSVTAKEYAWLSEREKAELVHDMTEPDCDWTD